MERLMRELGVDLEGLGDDVAIDVIEETELEEDALGNSTSRAAGTERSSNIEEFPEWREAWCELLRSHPNAMREAVLAEHDEEGEIAIQRVLYPIVNRLHETYWNCTDDLINALNDVAEETALFDTTHRAVAKKFMLLTILTIPETECAIVRDVRREWYEIDPGFKTFVNAAAPVVARVGKTEDVVELVKSFITIYRSTCLSHVPPSSTTSSSTSSTTTTPHAD